MDYENISTNLIHIGYARKSSEDNKERQAASLPDQLYIMEGIRAKFSLNVLETLQDSKSAHTPRKREQFARMLTMIENGEANAILTWHANRLARNMSDGGDIINLMDLGKLIEIRTPSRVYKNTPEDKWMLSVEFANSKKDSDDKSIVVDRGLEKKARDGWRPGVAPQGYLNDKTTESGLRRVLTDPERLPFIKKIFEMFYAGTSVTEIHRIAKDDWHFTTRQKKRSGGTPLSISMIYSILKKPFYCGKFEYPEGSGKWYDGQHEKAVDGEIFKEIQAKLGRKSQYKFQSHQFAYTGSLVHCGVCDSAIVAEEKWQCICTNCKLKFSLTKKNRERCTGCGMLIKNMKNPTILHYIYYRCGHKKNRNCNEKSIRLDILEGLIDEQLSQIDIAPVFADWAIKQIKKDNEYERDFREDTIKNINKAHSECRDKLDNLLQLKISSANKDGSLLSDEEYKKQKESLETLLKSIEKQLNDTDNRMIEANNKAEKAFTFAARARERFAETDDLKIKRDIFMGLGLYLKLQDKKVLFEAPKYIVEIKKMKKDIPIISARVEPEISPENMALLEEKYDSIPTLLRGQELRLAWKIMSLPCTVHYPACN